MANTFISNVPKIVNGDHVIGFTTSKTIKDWNWQSRSTLASWYNDDPVKNHIGMVDLFTNFAQVNVPMMKDLFKNKALLEVNGMDGSFTYDLPVYKPTGTFTMEDTSLDTEYPGLDEGIFTIVLSKPYQPNDVLSYDLMYGQQVKVSEFHEVEQRGENYLHYVQLVTNDKTKWFPIEKLKAGIQYWKVGNALNEFSEKFSAIESPDNQGTIKCEFILGNHRGVETYYTMYANEKSMSGATDKTRRILDTVVKEQEKYRDDMGRELNMFYMLDYNKATGKAKKGTERIGSTLEYLAILENMKIESTQLLFQKGAVIKSGNSVTRLNEGAFHQIRRGRRIEYSKPGGITREHIRQVAAYVFQGRTDLKPYERKLKFKVGYGAYQNFMTIFQEEFNRQLGNMSLLMGVDRVFDKNQTPVKGTLDALSIVPVIIKEVPIPDIGIVSVEHDPSLDYQFQSDRFSRGIFNHGYARDSYSALIWDASDPEYSNARQNLPAGTTLIDGGNAGANIYYVKPEGENMWWGYENGRYAPDRTSDIMSSLKTMGRGFWIHSASAAWVKDITKYVVLELPR